MNSNPKALPPRAYYRIEEVAHILTVSRSTVYRLIEEGELPVVRIRRSVRIRREDLERLEQLLAAQGDPYAGDADSQN